MVQAVKQEDWNAHALKSCTLQDSIAFHAQTGTDLMMPSIIATQHPTTAEVKESILEIAITAMHAKLVAFLKYQTPDVLAVRTWGLPANAMNIEKRGAVCASHAKREKLQMRQEPVVSLRVLADQINQLAEERNVISVKVAQLD